MVADRLTDGVRIGQLLASEVSGNEGRLRDLALADADPDVEPTTDGALAYRIVREGEAGGDGVGREVAEVYVHPDRVRVEFVGGDADRETDAVDPSDAPDSSDPSDAPDIPGLAAAAADEAGLRVRPKAVRPPRTLVFVEDGAQVKRALPVLEAVVDAI
ncbi:hypothetical protein [Halorubrum sp. Hd13]|uniref:hypothetical protein n=1 Tax=Halorubrum sp. Hd13 TaxID=1480728 RepID=UPI000B97E782|nr:hypothetical protein [Halorubrum sp. Hd13]OYR39766.1 hypothetical protein DJ81_15640 [Halorubrum sp. Hd13]